MKVTRAGFLRVCATAIVGLGADVPSLFGGVVHAAADAGVPPVAAASFDWPTASAALFQPHVNTAFTAGTADGASLSLVLERVIEHACAPDFEQFSLVFHASTAAAADAVHTIRHATLGEFDAFIAPIGPRRGGAAYEICFNRHR